MRLRGHQHSVELLSTSEANNRAALIEQGGHSQVPCLRIETTDGSVQWMYESDDIIAYLQQNGELAA
jgi:glutathione S-transferase